MTRRLLPAAFLLAFAAVAGADRDTAQFFTQRGDKAVQARNWTDAEQQYRRALEEDATFLPARCGLAEALLGQGQREPAIQELRQVETEATAQPPPPAWGAVLAKARKRLQELDSLGTELQKTVDEHVTALYGFATKWKEKDPPIAARALDLVIALRPGHEKATALLATLRRGSGVAGTPLFNGKDFGDLHAGPPRWSIEGGEMHGDLSGEATLVRSDTLLKGNFDVTLEARVDLKTERRAMLTLGAFKEEYRKVLYGFLIDELLVMVYEGTKEHDDVYAEVEKTGKSAYDPMAWNVYTLSFDKEQMHARVNGKEVYSCPRRPEWDALYPGLQVQEAKVSVRRFEYVQH